MNLGIIICPRCKKVKGIDLNYKTTRCPSCGKILNINKLKIFYKTDSPVKLQRAIGILNAKMDGKLDEFQKMLKNSNL